jgi:hypothetical protein
MTAIKNSATMTDATINKLASMAAFGCGAGDMRILLKRMRNADLYTVEVPFAFGALQTAGKVAVWTPANTTQTIKIRSLLLSGAGTNFNAGGDRTLALTDGTSIWTAIPAATLKALAAARWGDTGLPFPATAAHLLAASVAGSAAAPAVYLQYAGGTTDYTAGAGTLFATYEIVTE